MLRFVKILLVLVVACNTGSSSTFYVDPLLGDINNNGSITAPWSTLSAVIANNFIESKEYSPLPYDENTSTEVVKNADAPVHSGDTIILLSGLHGATIIDSYLNDEMITIMAAEGHTPILDYVRFRASRNWRLIGVHVSSEPSGYYTDQHLVWVDSHGFRGPSSHIEILNCEIYSGLDGWSWTRDEWLNRSTNGIYIRGNHVHVRDNVLTNIDMGVTIVGDHCDIINNQVINFSGDGMRPLGSFILIEGNLIKNCFDIDDNHDDGIQSFNLGTYNVSHVTIRNNIILNYDDPEQPLLGSLQGIGCFDGPYNNWIVENNVVSVNHWHGITFLGGYDCMVVNNTVIDPTPDITPGSSWIRIDDQKDGTPSAGCVVKNNISNKLIVDADESHNIQLTNYSDYADHFIDYHLYDFHLLSTSSAIDAGDSLIAPGYDIDGVVRPQGFGIDIGAYEYVRFSHINSTSPLIAKLYPHPCQDKIFIELSHHINGNKPDIQCINMLGQVYFMDILNFSSNIIHLNTKNLVPGIYSLRIANQSTILVKH